MLRQLGNSFIVQPNVLKSYMTESHLGRIDARLLRPYLAQRSDYNQFAKSLNLDDGPEPVTSTSTMDGSNVGNVGNSRMIKIAGGLGSGAGSRLSTMSGVAGAGMGRLREMLREFEADEPAVRSFSAVGTGDGGGGAARGKEAGWRQPAPMYFGMH